MDIVFSCFLNHTKERAINAVWANEKFSLQGTNFTRMVHISTII